MFQNGFEFVRIEGLIEVNYKYMLDQRVFKTTKLLKFLHSKGSESVRWIQDRHFHV